MTTLCIFTDYTDLSHVLCGEGLREEYKEFRVGFLHSVDWVSWHHKLVRAAPYTCGWTIRKNKLDDLKQALNEYKIPFVEKATFTPTTDAVTKKSRDQHTCKDMIYTAIREQQHTNRKGLSRCYIKRYIRANYNKLPLTKVFNNTLRKMVEKGELVKTGDSFKIGKPITKTALKTKTPKPYLVATYTLLWDKWEDESPLRMVWGESMEGGVTITIENKGVEEKFVVAHGDNNHQEAYEAVAKIAWEQSKLKDC